MPTITDEFRYLNLLEAALWLGIAVTATAIAARSGPGRVRSRCLVLAVTLLAFGLSDVVETRTGAWWRPWWLFAWKAVCVCVFLALLAEHYRIRFNARGRGGPPNP